MSDRDRFIGMSLWDIASKQFEVPDGELLLQLAGATLIFAVYESSGYEGSAFVLFERGGQLYEVNGSHCSCYGLEGKWDPEDTTVEALVHRMEKGELGKDYYGEPTFRKELAAALKAYALERNNSCN